MFKKKLIIKRQSRKRQSRNNQSRNNQSRKRQSRNNKSRNRQSRKRQSRNNQSRNNKSRKRQSRNNQSRKTIKKYRGGIKQASDDCKAIKELLSNYGSKSAIRNLAKVNINKKCTLGEQILHGKEIIINRNKIPNLEEIKRVSCDGISTKQDLKTKFKLFFQQFENLSEQFNREGFQRFTLKLFPYCGEKKLPIVDDLNNSRISHDVLNLFHRFFKIEINATGEGLINTTNRFNPNQIFTSVYSPDKFNNFISDPSNYNDNNNKKTIFIVTHSNFMNKLLQKILKTQFTKDSKFQFDNLDIMQLNINTQARQIKYIIIRRAENNYEPSIILDVNNLIQNIEILDSDLADRQNTNVFLMRHCVGCHNIIDNKFSRYRDERTLDLKRNLLSLVKPKIDETSDVGAIKKAKLSKIPGDIEILNYFINSFNQGKSFAESIYTFDKNINDAAPQLDANGEQIFILVGDRVHKNSPYYQIWNKLCSFYKKKETDCFTEQELAHITNLNTSKTEQELAHIKNLNTSKTDSRWTSLSDSEIDKFIGSSPEYRNAQLEIYTNMVTRGLSQLDSESNEGYLKYAICIQETVPMMIMYKEPLQSLLFKYETDINNIQFGSSLIFRAILTSILQYNVLFHTFDKKNPTPRSPKIPTPKNPTPKETSIPVNDWLDRWIYKMYSDDQNSYYSPITNKSK